MTDLPQEKKRMSKGCMVALIVVGAVVILIAAIAVTCYMNRDELMQYGARVGAQKVLSEFKTQIAADPLEGIDTVEINGIVDSFTVLLDSTELRLEDFGKFFQRIQSTVSDKVVDSADVFLMMDAMVEYFPELGGMRSGSEMPAETEATVQDSVMEDSL